MAIIAHAQNVAIQLVEAMRAPIDRIIPGPVQGFNAAQANELLTQDAQNSANSHTMRAVVFYLAAATAAVATIALASFAVVSATVTSFPVTSLAALVGAVIARHFGAKAHDLALMHRKKAEIERGVQKQFLLLNNQANIQAVFQRVGHPQLHFQLHAPENRLLLQRGLARIAYFQTKRAELAEAERNLRLELNQQEAKKTSEWFVLRKRLQVMDLQDHQRLLKVQEAFTMLILADPSIKQNLNQIVTFRRDLTDVAIKPLQRYVSMIFQHVGEKFHDLRAQTFITINNPEIIGLPPLAVDQATTAEIAFHMARAVRV